MKSCLACLFLFLATSIWANSYYLSAGGNDTNSGLTPDRSWKTLSKASSFNFAPGDILYLKGGTTFAGTLKLFIGLRGTQTSPITITSYGAGSATIWAGNGPALVLERASAIKIQKINLRGSGRQTNTESGLSISDSNSITVQEMEVSGFEKSGVSVFNSNSVSITKVFAHDNGFAGISVAGLGLDGTRSAYQKNLYIGYCRADNNPGDPNNLKNHSGNGIVIGSVQDGLVEFCEASGNGWAMPRSGNGPVGIWAWQSDRIVIQHCVSWGNRTSEKGEDGGGFDLDGGVTNSVIQYCLSYDNEGAGYGLYQYAEATPWENNTIRSCVSINDGTKNGQSALRLWNAKPSSVFRKALVTDNLFYQETGHAIQFVSPCSGAQFFNNVLISGGDLIAGTPKKDVRLLGNLYCVPAGGFRSDGFNDLQTWAAYFAQETWKDRFWGINANPRLRFTGLRLPRTTDALLPFKELWIRSPILSNAPRIPLKEFGIDDDQTSSIGRGPKW